MVAPFENRDDIKKNFGYAEVDAMIDILDLRINNETYMSEISKLINRKQSNLDNIIKYLSEIGIIDYTRVVGSTKMFKINNYLLKHFLDEQENITRRFDKKYNTIKYNDYH